MQRRAVADVDLDVEGGRAEPGELLAGAARLLGLVVGDDDRRPRLREVVGHAPPDALPGAGDDHDPAGDVVHGAGVVDRDLGVQHAR